MNELTTEKQVMTWQEVADELCLNKELDDKLFSYLFNIGAIDESCEISNTRESWISIAEALADILKTKGE